MVVEDIDISTKCEYKPPIQYVDDMDIEEETQNDLLTLQRTKFKIFEKLYHGPISIVNLNMTLEQKKRIKIPLATMMVSFSTFLLQMIKAISQVLEQSSSRGLYFYHYNDESLLMYNFFIDSNQEDILNHRVMQYCELFHVLKKAMFERAYRWYVKLRCMLWFSNFLMDEYTPNLFFDLLHCKKETFTNLCNVLRGSLQIKIQIGE